MWEWWAIFAGVNAHTVLAASTLLQAAPALTCLCCMPYSARASCFAVQQLLSCKFRRSQGALLCEEAVDSRMCVQQGHVIGACADLL